ncbi:MAG: DUF4835 family protein [Sphingobacteriia bacterium]|nr:MAG: DUF4835 family protein [Sphingobacteriia bacterium]
MTFFFWVLWVAAGWPNNLCAQELNAKVTVLAQRVNSTVDRRIFVTLQNQLNSFVNNRKWGGDAFAPQEKILCSFILNIESILETNVYKASLTIQSARPVFQTGYRAALINFVDPDLAFKYIEFQPMEFNENRIQGTDPQVANLTAVLAFYVYMVMGMDYDSFSPKGGEPYFRKAQNIVNNAPEGRNISGWRVFDGLRNRYWLGENLSNARYNLVHDVIYTYYRGGLDKMIENENEARQNILQALVQLQAFNKENPNTMVLQFFMQGKATELIGICAKGTPAEKNQMVQLAAVLDVVNAEKYKTALR